MQQAKLPVRLLFLIMAAATLTPWVSAPVALLGGFVFAQVFRCPYPDGSARVSSLLLKIAIVGLGFGMNLQSALKAGQDGFWLTLASICLILVLGVLAGRLLKMPQRVSWLVASGTAICGGSAIAAVGPAVRASAEEMSVALGVVFLLNAAALLLFPILGHALGLDQYHFGIWSAIAIHDTSSVVGAASAYGDEALQVATTVKLARALWIIPLTLLSLFLFRDKQGKRKLYLPLFIAGFIAAMLANTWLPLPAWFSGGVTAAAKSSLALCLFLIGSALNIGTLRAVGWQPLALGLTLWVVCSLFSLGAILYLV